jgi:hypothetical protein
LGFGLDTRLAFGLEPAFHVDSKQKKKKNPNSSWAHGLSDIAQPEIRLHAHTVQIHHHHQSRCT